MSTFTTQQICDKVGGQLVGSPELAIQGVNRLERAKAGQISFIRNNRFAEQWAQSQASAALIGPGVELEPGQGRSLIAVPNADLALAVVLDMFLISVPGPQAGVHARATVDPAAKIGQEVAIGAGSFIGPDVLIGDRCTIHPGVTILAQCQIGDDCEIFPGVVIRERCSLGHRVILQPNVVLGADGFNYRPSPETGLLVKIPHIGTVEIHDDVEIGAGTCVDRGKFAATVIGRGSKIDNLCQIAHNCELGQCCVLAGMVGLAGSVILGDGVMLGGGVMVKDQVTIGSGASILGHSSVMTDVPAGVCWGGMPAQDAKTAFREVAALRKLPGALKALKRSK
jgi:UDP-3-O-[3-hydroxymyristoyl] glucosamine N-acyltransferase